MTLSRCRANLDRSDLVCTTGMCLNYAAIQALLHEEESPKEGIPPKPHKMKDV